MDDINIRVGEVIQSLGLTTTAIAKRLGVSWTTINNYTKGRIPDGRTLISFKQKLDVDVNWLLTGEGSMFLNKEGWVKPSTHNFVRDSMTPYVISANAQGEENVILVPHYAQAGYLDGYGDPEYLEMLPSYRLPLLNNGTFRMFEVKGHSMTPTLHDSSIAVGEWCENFTDIQDDQIYIVVTKDDGIVIKRLLNRIDKYGNLYLKSDNRSEYPSYTIKPEDVVELWKLKTAFVFNFSNPADLYDRVTDLESEMMQLRAVLVK